MNGYCKVMMVTVLACAFASVAPAMAADSTAKVPANTTSTTGYAGGTSSNEGASKVPSEGRAEYRAAVARCKQMAAGARSNCMDDAIAERERARAAGSNR
jgi:hypothetical protein